MITRDRAGAYADGDADGARQGAPGAAQVADPGAAQAADRWHLLRNVSDALRQLADRYHARWPAPTGWSGVNVSA